MKKLLLTYLATSLFALVSIAQAPCATQMPPEMMNWLKAYKHDHPGAIYKVSANDSMIYLPLKVHSVGTDAGVGFYKVSQVLDMICKLNEFYVQVGWQFYLYGDIDYISSTNLDQHTGSYQPLINSTSIVNVANVFFVTNPSGNCGYYTQAGGPGGQGHRQGFVAINKSCGGPNDGTVAHELGHFFSLPHPFYGWEGRNSDTDPAISTDERVDGSNCQYAGDYFCDTRADYLNYRWNCPYTATKTDYNGDRYNPDGKLIMGYSVEPCADIFTPEQIDAMHGYLASNRSYMTAIGHVAFPEITDTAKIIFPANNTAGVPSQNVKLIWKSVPNATHYSVQVTKSPTASVYDKDTIIEGDTSVLFTDLTPNVVYRWRVRAFNRAKTCSPYTYYNLFTTNGSNALVTTFDVSNVHCNGDSSGSILVNVSGGSDPYSFHWSSGGNTSYIVDLTGGNYVVTVVDISHDSAVYAISLAQPSQLTINFGYSGNNIVAAPSGGSPGYTYNWSNGATTANPGTLAVGNYSVTVTDANGCTASKLVSYSAVEELTGIHNLNIYPNPAANGQAVTLEMTSGSNFTGTIDLYDNTGRKALTLNKEFTQGNNRFDINLDKMSAGVYLVKITGKDVSINHKMVIY